MVRHEPGTPFPPGTPAPHAGRMAGDPRAAGRRDGRRAGFDWIGLDLQHGAWDLGTAFRGIQLADALGKPVVIRLPDEQLALIPRVLDHGASGIVLAMASEPAVVAAAIERARYQPQGKRSYGGQRYGMRPEPIDPPRSARRSTPCSRPDAASKRSARSPPSRALAACMSAPPILASPSASVATCRPRLSRSADGDRRRRSQARPAGDHARGRPSQAALGGDGLRRIGADHRHRAPRSAFADLIRDARAALGDTDAPAASSLAAYGRPA